MAAPCMFARDLPSCLPRELQQKLLPFQRDGIKFALSRKGRCLIGDEMGLGKTLQAITVAYCYQSEWPLLIVVPTALRYIWIEELEKWLPELQPNDFNLIASGTDIRNIPNCKVSIVGYGLFRNDGKTLMEAITKQHFQVVIVDESHYLKNAKAARTKLILPIIQEARRAILLTGTPALGRPSELFTQINSLRPNIVGSYAQFCKRYCDAHWQYYGRTKRSWNTQGASNLDELHRKLKGSIMIRREKKNVLTQLPPKRRQKVPFELADSAQKKELDMCWLEMRQLWKPESEEAGNPKFQIQTLAGRMYVLTGKAKIGAVCEYVKLLLENQGLKFLVFAHHKEMMTALAQTVMAYQKEHKAKFKYIRIDGSVPSLERAHLVRQFQNDEDTRVAILSILAAGTGLTFTAASQVVFAELHWTPGILEQCEDRAHRIGQINAIHVHYLVARGTMDEWIWSALSRKVSVLSSALNGRLQKLKMEEGGEEYAELLKHAAAWLPSNQDDEENESFYFTQKNKSQDIRSFFTPSSTTKGKKRKRPSGGKSTPKISRTDRNIPATSTCSKLIVDHSEITLDSDNDMEDEPILNSVLSSVENQNKRSSLEDFVDTAVKQPIRKKISCDIAEPATIKGKQVMKKTKSQTNQESVKEHIFSNYEDNKSGLVKHATDLASGTDDGLPVMKTFIRRRLKRKKRKSTTQDEINKVDEGLTHDINVDSPFCSRIKQDKGQASCVITPVRVGKDSCVTPIHSRANVGEHGGERSAIGGRKQGDVEERKDHVTWNCNACTFENHSALSICEICNTPRKNVNTRSQTKFSFKSTSAQSWEGPSASTSVVKHEQSSKITSQSDSASDHITAFVTSDLSETATTDEVSACIDDESTAIDDESAAMDIRTDSDSANTDVIIHDNSDIPMSVACDSDDISNQGSLCNSEDLFADCETDNRQSLRHVFSSKSVKSSSDNNTTAEKGDTISEKCISETANNSNVSNNLANVDNNMIEDDINSLDGEIHPLPSPEPLRNVARTNATTCQNGKLTKVVDKGHCTTDIESFALSEMDNLGLQGELNVVDNHNIVEPSINEAASSKKQENIPEAQRKIPLKEDNTSKQIIPQDHPLSDSESDESDVAEPKVYESFLYCASKHTDRIYLYDQDQLPLRCFFFTLDVQHRDLDALPVVLHQPDNLALVRRFVKEWNSLNEIKRKQLRRSGYIFDSPIQAHEALKKGRPYDMCNKRFLTKEDLARSALEKAKDVGGTVRVVAKPTIVFKKGSRRKDPSKPQINAAKPGKSTGQQIQKQGLQSPSGGTDSSCVGSESERDSTVLSDSDATTSAAIFTASSESHNSCDEVNVLNSTSAVITRKKAYLQVVDKDGSPLCLYCDTPMTCNADSTHDSAAWDRRYCSEQCKEEHGLRKNTTFLREKLLEVEHGICQHCGIHAHDLFTQVRDMARSQRKEFLKTTPYAKLSAVRLNDMIKNTSAGQFWHADHIIAVYEGGGLCSLDNLRTLCVMCHDKVTAVQKKLWKKQKITQKQRQAGFGDITKFLKP